VGKAKRAHQKTNQNKMPQPSSALNPNIRKAQPEARELAVILSEAKNPLKNIRRSNTLAFDAVSPTTVSILRKGVFSHFILIIVNVY